MVVVDEVFNAVDAACLADHLIAGAVDPVGLVRLDLREFAVSGWGHPSYILVARSAASYKGGEFL